MQNLNSKTDYEELKTKINELNYHYYTLDTPKTTDNEWDELYSNLLEMEAQHPDWISPDSPSQRVGGALLEGFVKAPHTISLLSLDKAQNYERIGKFFDDVFKELGRIFQVSLELKFDGLSIVLRYENGYLVQARTRGRDGVGEEVTAQVKTIKSIPLSIPFKGLIEVQGEIFMPLSRLKELNEELQVKFDRAVEAIKASGRAPTEEEIEKLQDEYKLFNERNVASGSVRQLDPKVTAARKLDAFFYNVVLAENLEFHTQADMMVFLKEQGFKVNSYFYVLDSYNEVVDKLEEMLEIRPTLNFAIDGMVIKVNEIGIRETIGYTAKHPKFAIAYKFIAQEYITTIRDIELDVGRTGQISFVGLLDEINIDGVNVSRVTLNNMGDIMRKGVLIGGEVFIKRSNDVIPEVTGAVPGTNGEKVEPPTTCPSCNSELVEVGALLFCRNNDNCPAQVMKKFEHFSKREAMNIEGLSEKTILQLINDGLLRKLSDLYFLKKEELLKIERFGEKKADNLLGAIEVSKNRPLKSFLYALGIRNVGKTLSADLIHYFKSIESLSKASIDELQNVDGVRSTISQNIYDYFNDEENQKELSVFRKLGIKMELEEISQQKNSKFSGKVFVITGSLSKPRPQIAAFIEEHGGVVSNSITKKTDFLVLGLDAGKKKEKAEKLGVIILSEDDLMRLDEVRIDEMLNL